jgi:hypothetical protein
VGVEGVITASITVYRDEESARPPEERLLWDTYATLGYSCTEECDEVDSDYISPSGPDFDFSGISLCDEPTLVRIGAWQGAGLEV